MSIARFINRHFVPLISLAIAGVLAAVIGLLCCGCDGLRDDESKRPPPQPVDVMDQVQATADTHPLAGMSQ